MGNLAGNSIGDEGSSAVAIVLPANNVLKSLNLQRNNIGTSDLSLKNLTNALKMSSTYRMVDTRFNRTGFPEQFSSDALTERTLKMWQGGGGRVPPRKPFSGDEGQMQD